MQNINIDSQQFTFKDLESILYQPVKVSLSPSVKDKITTSHDVVVKAVQDNQPFYGVNTGFGKLANIRIDGEQLTKLQTNLLLSHAVGVGDLLPENTVRLIMFLKIASLSKGHSGISLATLESLILLLNNNVYPLIPKKGSVGASGDLAPLAHMSLPLIGEGSVSLNQEHTTSKQALDSLNLKPIILQPKDGLALINGTQVSTAVALHALYRTIEVFKSAIVSGAMTSSAIMAKLESFSPEIQQIRGHAGQIQVASIYYRLLSGGLTNDNLQDPYSIRCQPQVMGACLDQIQHVAKTLLIEANSVTDNPLVVAEQQKILCGGNFHAEPVALVSDLLALVIAEIGSILERRIALLMDTNMSGLPPFLIKNEGLNSGFMILQVTASAIVSENRQLASPLSVDNVPTSANQEDHVSMATNSANRLHFMLENLIDLVGIEIMSAAQAMSLNVSATVSTELQIIYAKVRKHIPVFENDVFMQPYIQKARQLVTNAELTSSIELEI